MCAIASTTISSAGADTRTQEQYLLDVPTVSGALADATRINAQMHYAGTPGDRDLAIWMRDRLTSYGFNATNEAFMTDVPQPKRLVLQLLDKPRVDFDLKEAAIASDPDGSRRDVPLPYNAWSGNGDVRALLVDAGYGTENDYASLTRDERIDVRSRIVLVRYGKEFRGNLARRALLHGAAGVIFFSDPDGRDGANRGPAYPDGPYRPLGSLQRGSLGTPRLTIPTLPVTAVVAERLIAAMHGTRITSVPVHLKVDETIKRTTLWNTVGILEGSDPSHMVVLGAHRDAWVYGVTDNGAGISTLLETAHALGYLYRSGWRPRFSIVIAGFDGEEVGEVGSQAYVRMHEGMLRNGCVAYINQDENATGQFFAASAAAALQDTIAPVTARVRDPRTFDRTLYQRWSAQKGGVNVSGPGGGSDFEAFLYNVGIPTIDFGFEGTFGVYHSAFDDLRYATTQADPGFVNHRAAAQAVALLAMRLANGSLAYRFSPYASRMRASLSDLRRQGVSANDLAPLLRAVKRFTARAAWADAHGVDGNTEIPLIQRVDLLYYGRNGYAPVAFPVISATIANGNGPMRTDAIYQTSDALDKISSSLLPHNR